MSVNGMADFVYWVLELTTTGDLQLGLGGWVEMENAISPTYFLLPVQERE